MSFTSTAYALNGSPCPYCQDGEVAGGQYCEGPKCGDGNVTAPEQCDNGTANSDTVADACRTNCQLPRCGDGVKDPSKGEECDGSADCTVDCKKIVVQNPCSKIPAVEITQQFTCSAGIVTGYASVNGRKDAWIAVPTDERKYPDGRQIIIKTTQLGFQDTIAGRFIVKQEWFDVDNSYDQYGNRLAQVDLVVRDATGNVVRDANGRAVFLPKFDAAICYSESALRCGHSFDPEALITLADGSTKMAKELTVKDALMDPSGKAVSIKSIVQSSEEFPLYELKAGKASVRVTRNHVIWTPDGLKQANSLKIGDKVKLQSGDLVPLDSVTELPAAFNQDAYGVVIDTPADATDDASLMIGGGIVVGDFKLEGKLAGDSKK